MSASRPYCYYFGHSKQFEFQGLTCLFVRYASSRLKINAACTQYLYFESRPVCHSKRRVACSFFAFAPHRTRIAHHIIYHIISSHLIDTIRNGTVRYETKRYDTIRYDTIRNETKPIIIIHIDRIILFGDTIRYDTTRYDTIRHDTVRYGTVRYDLLHLEQSTYGTVSI
jgi:hypothetical protein